MENDRVLQAIHELDLKLTDRIHTQTTVMEVMNERLDNLRIAVDRHREILYGHDDGDRVGLVATVADLQKKEKERVWTMRTVTVAFFGLLANFIWELFSG